MPPEEGESVYRHSNSYFNMLFAKWNDEMSRQLTLSFSNNNGRLSGNLIIGQPEMRTYRHHISTALLNDNYVTAHEIGFNSIWHMWSYNVPILFDSGSNVIVMPFCLWHRFKAAFGAQAEEKVPCYLREEAYAINITLNHGQSVVIDPMYYIIQSSSNPNQKYCHHRIRIRKESEAHDGDSWVIGTPFFMGRDVTYMLEGNPSLHIYEY